jgi:hypothetical protein
MDLLPDPGSIAVIVAVIVFATSCFFRFKRLNYPSWDNIDESSTLKVSLFDALVCVDLNSPEQRFPLFPCLKVGGSKKRIEEFASEPIDYIIVGSGLGGLTCASLLAKAGNRVLVLEQHDIAGGATHTFEDKVFYLFIIADVCIDAILR